MQQIEFSLPFFNTKENGGLFERLELLDLFSLCIHSLRQLIVHSEINKVFVKLKPIMDLSLTHMSIYTFPFEQNPGSANQ